MTTLAFTTPRLRALALCSLLLAGMAQAAPVVELGPHPGDAWSAQVAQTWLPRTQATLALLDQQLVNHYGRAKDSPLRQLMVAVPKGIPEGVDPKTVARVEAGLHERDLRGQALSLPVRRMLQETVKALSGSDAPKAIPSWFLDAWMRNMLAEVTAPLNLPELASPVLPEQGPAAAQAWQARQLRLAGDAVLETLSQQLGEQFHQKMRHLLEGAAAPGADTDSLFRQVLGRTPEALLADATPEAAQRLAAQRQRQQSGVIRRVSQLDLSQDPPWIREAMQQFQAMPQPRALALSAQGGVGMVSQRARLVEEAMAACRRAGKGPCWLFAEDDQVILRPDAVYVVVQMGGHAQGPFAQEVADDWLPIVKFAAGQFNRLVNDQMKVRFSRTPHVYVAAGQQDYDQVLQDDLDIPPSQAAVLTDVSGGLSGQGGRIAIQFRENASSASKASVAVKTSLHELTHELQKQLGQGYARFQPMRWMVEGSADYYAAKLASQLVLPEKVGALSDWRSRVLGWWRKKPSNAVTPTEVFRVTHEEWVDMMRERRGNYDMAGLMTMYLAAIQGDEFDAHWIQYFTSAGRGRVNAAGAFETAFGMAPKEFLGHFERWLQAQ